MGSIIQTRKFGQFASVRCGTCDSCLTTDGIDDFVFDEDELKLAFTVKCIICGSFNPFCEPIAIEVPDNA